MDRFEDGISKQYVPEECGPAEDGPAQFVPNLNIGGIPTKAYYQQPYHVTIIVKSPKFSGQVQGYSSISLENAHDNAWAKLRNPAAKLEELK